jgi:hypothetical protein
LTSFNELGILSTKPKRGGNFMRRKLFVFSILMVFVGAAVAWGADIEQEIAYKKKTSIAGPVQKLFRFSLWDAATVGNMVWSEEKQAKVNSSGVISTFLGDTVPLNPGDFLEQLWVQVDRVKAGPTYTPVGLRDKLTMSPYAMQGLGMNGLNPLFEPMTNVPEVFITAQGWEVCYSDLYNNSTTPLSTIFSQCTKSNLMLACRPVGSANFTVAAFANRNDVLTDTGPPSDNINITHVANGEGWYYNSNSDFGGWGYAKAGDPVAKTQCDTRSTENADKRLCWHTFNGNLSYGYRCGTTTGLNGSTTWERVILHHQ